MRALAALGGRSPKLAALHLAPHCAVPVVLDGVVGAAGQELRDLGPLVAVLCVLLHQHAVLLLGPLPPLDAGIQVIVPSVAGNPHHVQPR